VLTAGRFPTSRPRHLDELNRLPCLSLSTRAIMLTDRCHEVADKNPPAVVRQAQIIAAILKEVMTNEARRCSIPMQQQALDADAALQELGSDAIGQAFVTATVTSGTTTPIRRGQTPHGRESHSGTRLHLMTESVNAVEAWLDRCLATSMPMSTTAVSS